MLTVKVVDCVIEPDVAVTMSVEVPTVVPGYVQPLFQEPLLVSRTRAGLAVHRR